MALIPLQDAQAVVRAGCAPLVPLAPRTVPLADALGCVLAAPAIAGIDVPPFANSAMDGYAVRAADVASAPVSLEVVGRVLAGSVLGGAVGRGQAARIMTGAPLPAGADAVCMVEHTRPDAEGRVIVEEAVASGQNVRAAGTDVASGAVVLEPGQALGAVPLAALLSAGVREVQVRPRPRVGVISTGDELVDHPAPLGPAQIYDSNRPMLLALVEEAGCAAVDLGRSPDDEASLARRIEDALGAVDALVLSGGVSVGDVDVVRSVLERLGRGATRWMQIAIRPAKPFSFTTLRGPSGTVPVFGLPGNPVSSAVSFELLVRPSLRAMGGHRALERPRVAARVAEPLHRQADGKLHLARVRLEPDGDGDAGGPGWVARPCPGQSSHQIRSMAIADGLALLPDGGGFDEGETLEVIVTNAELAAAPTPGPPVATPGSRSGSRSDPRSPVRSAPPAAP